MSKPVTAQTEQVEWDEEVQVLVTYRVRVRTNPEYFEGLEGRTPLDLAMTAAFRGGLDPSRTDGWADFVGDVDPVDVQEGY